jgi:two-component system sensor kinase FixL
MSTLLPPADDAARRWRPRFEKWETGAVVVGLTLSLVVVSTVMLSVNVSRFRDSQHLVEHSDSVLFQIDAIEKKLVDAGLAERGYLLSGERRYLGIYMQLRNDIPASLYTLRPLIADNEAQLRRLDALNESIDERVALMDDIIAMGPEKLTDALPMLRTNRPLRLSERILGGLAEIGQVEQEQRNERVRAVEGRASQTAVLAAATGVLAAITAVLAAFLFRRQHRAHRIRERRARLRHAARLRATNETAALFAHELTQPLAIAMNYLETLDSLGDRNTALQSSPDPGVLRMTTAQVERAAEIVNRLRDHARENAHGRNPEAISSVARGAIELMDLNPGSVTVRNEIPEASPPVLIDKVRIEQVLINLIRNAVQAVERSARREVTLSAPITENGMLRICVRDTGPGLTNEAAARLFEPFAAAKDSRMGIGLSICRNIVRAHGGTIWLESNSAGGAVFCFTVPIAPGDLDPAEPPPDIEDLA